MIWGKYGQYSKKNSIIIDDLRRNFLMNPRSGLKVRECIYCSWFVSAGIPIILFPYAENRLVINVKDYSPSCNEENCLFLIIIIIIIIIIVIIIVMTVQN